MASIHFLKWQTTGNHKPVFSSFMTYHGFCNKSNTTGATCGDKTAA